MKDIFAKRLRTLREKHGYTQKEFAEKAGVSSSSYNAYEQGTKAPPLTSAAKIAKALGVSLDWLCGMDSDYEVRTYAEVAKMLRALDQAIGIGMEEECIVGGKGAIIGYIKIGIGKEGAFLENVEGEGQSKAFLDFLTAWKNARSFVKAAGETSSQFLEPWFQEQFRKLDIPLPRFEGPDGDG